ncbi:uncharacterized protein LOC129313160 isoform X2 [Prosopis cineraria]|uniref:uncharacterized protein LOC129313160 isoform X2 n=1 Tax=Prosopis cineraria TaxID=364024 RepID=UPI00241084CC|nr:uncharacterized protein LOC129313160 isoform X2 [Prosopis cineraria]
MSRFLGCGNVKRFAHSLIQKQKTSCWEVFNIGPHCTGGSPFSAYRSSLYYRLILKKNFLTSGKARNFCAFKENNVNNQCAQVVWSRISQIYFHTVPALPPIGQIARAVSLALFRSNVIVPGVVFFIAGELSWTHQTWAEAESFPSREILYMHAQDGQLYLATALFNVLEIFILFFRAIYLLILFLPCIAISPFVDFGGVNFRKTWIHFVRLTLEKAGSAFIKWGQWAATRPDLFPKDLCSELAKLHTKAPSHEFSYSRKSIENAFGRKLHEIFENFDEDPVASGSIAQVHRATLKYRYPGQQIKPVVVAVKVRHPGVSEAIRRDFIIINLLAKISRFLPNLKWLKLDESLQQFAIFMMSQVDLSREAAHLSRFIYNFRKWKDVSFPKPLYPLVHPSVLVETYEHGENVSYYVDELEGHEKFKTTLAHIGTHALLKMLLVDNFIHADMHPGNILVRRTQSRSSQMQLFKSRPHVVFLDVGMTTELSKREQQHLLEFFKAVSVLDGHLAAQCTLKLSKQQSCPDPKSFIEGWQRRLDPEYDVMRTLQTLLFRSDLAKSLSYTIEGLMAP